MSDSNRYSCSQSRCVTITPHPLYGGAEGNRTPVRNSYMFKTFLRNRELFGNAYWRVPYDYVPTSYPGTGDIFASVLTGGMMNGDSFPIAIERATRFIELAIKTTFSYGTDTRYGVMLEKCLPWLSQNVVLKGYEIL